VFGSLLCYEYAWNSYTRPKRSEFSKVVREYNKLVRESLMTSGKTYIPHIGFFKLVKSEGIPYKMLDYDAMVRYKELYPNRPERKFYTQSPTEVIKINLSSRLPGFPWDISIKWNGGFKKEVLKAHENNRCFIYNKK